MTLASRHGALALHLMTALVASLSTELDAMTDRVGVLLRERSAPRRANVNVTLDGVVRTIATSTRVGELLPREKDGARVVGALLDDRPVALDTAIVSDARVVAVTMAMWEGR